MLYKNASVRKFLGGPIKIEDISLKAQSTFWIIRNREDDAFIGTISLSPHHDGIDTEVSYQLHPNFWKKGIATEVLKEVIEYAFSSLKLNRLVAETQVANVASIRLLERVGMKKERNIERFGEVQSLYVVESSSKS